jgi:hypothetical protein
MGHFNNPLFPLSLSTAPCPFLHLSVIFIPNLNYQFVFVARGNLHASISRQAEEFFLYFLWYAKCTKGWCFSHHMDIFPRSNFMVLMAEWLSLRDCGWVLIGALFPLPLTRVMGPGLK